jgi:hypothetical protein
MNTLNYIVKEMPDWQFIYSLKEKIIISFNIKDINDLKNININSLHANRIYLTDNFSFSLYFNFENDKAANDKLISDILENKMFLLQLIYHPKFARQNGIPIIFILKENEYSESLNLFMNDVRSFLFSIGIEELECINCNNKNKLLNTELGIVINYRSKANFEEKYYNLLQNYYIGNYIGIVIEEIERTIIDISICKEMVEDKFKSNSIYQYLFSENYIHFKNTSLFLKSELKKKCVELENQNIYINILKHQDEAIKINNFYFNEYEILPSWYKRFGHIIKVLQGKRSFSSLYNNSNKKK